MFGRINYLTDTVFCEQNLSDRSNKAIFWMKYNVGLNGFPLLHIDIHISFASFTNFLGKFFICPRTGM